MKLLRLVVMTCLLTSCAVDPHPSVTRSVPPDSPSLVPRTTLEPTPRPLATPKPLSTVIYVLNKNVDKTWQLQEAVNSWQPAKYTEIKIVNKCPSDWNIPCVTFSMTDSLSTEYAGETNFGSLPSSMFIHLNNRIQITGAEKETTICHEFGHILGLGHVKGTRKSCMYNDNYYRQYPLVATKLDLSLVDQLGSWDQDKMYDSSGKDIDIRTAPR